MNEHEHQKSLIMWANLSLGKYPQLALLYAIPNGGQRNVIVASKLKLEGVKAGVPDLCLPVANNKYHGLYIEMKSEKGTTQANQKEWLKQLNKQGYKAIVCKGWHIAKEELENYLQGENGQ